MSVYDMNETTVMHMDRVDKRDFKEALAKAVYDNFTDGEEAVVSAVDGELESWLDILSFRDPVLTP